MTDAVYEIETVFDSANSEKALSLLYGLHQLLVKRESRRRHGKKLRARRNEVKLKRYLK